MRALSWRPLAGLVATAALVSSACTTLLGAEDDYRLRDETPLTPDPELGTPCSRLATSVCRGTDAAVAPTDIDRQLRLAHCRALQRCNLLAQGAEEACLTGVNWSWLWPAQAAVEAGTVGYDGQAFACCLADLDALTCDELTDQRTLRESTHCRRSFPVAARGRSCFDSLECAEAEYCELGASCPGQCRPRAGSGAGCVTADSCVLGASCKNGVCTGHVCAGAPCENAGDAARNSVCVAHTSCRKQLPSTPSACLAPPGLDAYCDLNALACDGQTSCQLASLASPLKGGTCEQPRSSGPCQLSSGCREGTFCAGNVSQRSCLPQFTAGAKCVGSGSSEPAPSTQFALQCVFPLHCLATGDASTCRAFTASDAASGAACHGPGNDCPAGHFCERVGLDDAPRCRPTRAEGLVCLHDGDCTGGFCRLDTQTCGSPCRRPPGP